MKTNYYKNSNLFITTLLLVSTLFSANINCKSQQINNENNLIASINLNTFKNNKSEKSLKQAISEKIIKHLKLSLNEKKILMEIKQLAIEAKQCLNDADIVAKEINEINKTSVNSDEMVISNLKGERKIKRQENYESSIRYDAEELFEMSNDLLFSIYEDHFPTSVTLLAKNNKCQQQITDLNDQAQELFKKANENQDKAIYDLNYMSGLDYLKKANFLKSEAIKKYELAYSLYYNLPINKNEYSTLSAASNYDFPDEEALISDNASNKSDKLNNTLPEYGKVDCNNEVGNTNKLIIYRVQIGAFTKKVNVKEFHGLNPLVEDKKDQKEFAKYMIGEYFSYKAASEAKRIIASTTKYQDAFIVAYNNDLRITISNELLK